jgi:hypothetical protein
MEIKINEELCILYVIDKMTSCPHVENDYKKCNTCGKITNNGHTCRIYRKKLKKAGNGYCYRCKACLAQNKPKARQVDTYSAYDREVFKYGKDDKNNS